MVLRVTNTDPNARDELIGQQVGASYVIKERLGEGGMGLVYLAESTKIGGSIKLRGRIYGGKLAAVKVLTARSSEAIARFRAEAYAAGKVDKFSVVDILDAGELATGQSYILMEYCDGGSLQDLLQERGTVEFSYDEILSILSPVCAALVKAHEADLVHRDIKPANILFVKNGKVLRARLSDFGLVKLREHAAFLMTARNAVMGTPGYMSPEQCVDTANVDSRSDIYSVGCVLYLLLTGRLPYLGTMNDLIRQAKENAPIALPSVFRRKLPPGWERVAMSCLAFRREERFQTALEVINGLADGLENGRSLMGFHAPILVEDIALGPAANTVTSAAGGPAAKVWTTGQSAIHQRERSLQRRSLAMFLAGIAVGTIATGALALEMRSADQLDGPRIALDKPETAHALPAPTSPDDDAHASPAPASSASASSPSSPSVAHTVARVDAMPKDAATRVVAPAVDVATPNVARVDAMPEDAATRVVAPDVDVATPNVAASASATTQPAGEAIAPKPPIPTKPTPPRPAPSASSTAAEPPANRPPMARATGDTTSEAWLSIRVKGSFAQVSIDGDQPSMSPKRKRVQVGSHHVVMTGYPDGSETQQRKEFDVNVPAGKDETIIYKTW